MEIKKLIKKIKRMAFALTGHTQEEMQQPDTPKTFFNDEMREYQPLPTASNKWIKVDDIHLNPTFLVSVHEDGNFVLVSDANNRTWKFDGEKKSAFLTQFDALCGYQKSWIRVGDMRFNMNLVVSVTEYYSASTPFVAVANTSRATPNISGSTAIAFLNQFNALCHD